MSSRKKTSRTQPHKSSDNTGDVITIQNTGDNSAIAAGRGAQASIIKDTSNNMALIKWQDGMKKAIDASSSLSVDDKADAHEQVKRITAEASKGKQANINRLEKLINTLGVMAPDIFDVALATLGNPLAGLGLVAKKVGEKAKIEMKS